MSEATNGLELQPAPPIEALLPDRGVLPWWLITFLLVLITATLLFLILRKRRTSAESPLKIRETAYRAAAAALSGIQSDDARDTAVQSSLVLRKYLSVAADDPALFETHEEFIARRDALKTLSDNARTAAEDGFTRLAALKYGPDIPGTPAADVISESRAMLETLHHGFAA